VRHVAVVGGEIGLGGHEEVVGGVEGKNCIDREEEWMFDYHTYKPNLEGHSLELGRIVVLDKVEVGEGDTHFPYYEWLDHDHDHDLQLGIGYLDHHRSFDSDIHLQEAGIVLVLVLAQRL